MIIAIGLPMFATWKTKELPESISAMVYIFDEKYKWLWSMWLWAVTILMAPSLIDALPYNFQFVGFLMIACLTFVGAFPLFDEDNKKWHYILGIAAGIISQICVALICFWCLFLWILLPIIAYFGKKKEWLDGKGVFITECICAITNYGSILIHNI